MARRRGRGRTVTRYVNRVRSRVRRPRRNEMSRVAKKAGMGVLGGLAVSIPLTLAAQYLGRPQLVEAGQRGGAVLASHLGGTPGQVGYQIADALFDRFVVYQGQGISGSNGAV